MFDGVFDVFAEVLNFFYTLVPNYAIAIALLTLARDGASPRPSRSRAPAA